MSYEKVKKHFESIGLGKRVTRHEQSSATVEDAANSIGCPIELITKTLTFLVNEKPIIVAVAGDAKIHNAKYKAQFKQKAQMIPREQVEKLIGHAPGSVCPFAVNENVEVFLDISLKRFDVVYTAGGDLHSHVEVSISELEKHSRSVCWVDVSKGWFVNENES